MYEMMVSVVMVVRDQQANLPRWLAAIEEKLAPIARDYEVIIVDNASADLSVAMLESLSVERPNLQIYCLSSPVTEDVAVMAGLEQAIGDYMLAFDPRLDDIAQISVMLKEAVERGNDVVLARALDIKADSRLYDALARCYIRLFRFISGLDLRIDTPRFRLLSRRVVNYILQHEDAAVIYQIIPVASGFKRSLLEYRHSMPLENIPPKQILDGVKRGLSLMVGTSMVPMRFASITSLVAALLSLLYSFYVVGVFFFKDGVMPGWTTLSLQMSGMFFLMSLALAILAEYVVHISAMASRRPQYHIAREFRSNQITREQRLNIVQGSQPVVKVTNTGV